MNNNRWVIILIMLLGCIWLPYGMVYGQADTSITLQQKAVIAGSYSRLSVDNLGNIYALSMSGNQIKKMGPKGDSIALFNDVKQYGNIYSMDVANPLKIMLYYRDYATILSLDRFLNNINKIDLRQSGILQAKAVSQSYDNQFWVFDMQEYRLKKINDNGQVGFVSDDFRILFSHPLSPATIIDRDGSLYLYDPEAGWCIMDYYGAVKGEYPYTGWENVGIRDGKLYGWKKDHLVVFDPNNFNSNSYRIPLAAQELNYTLLVDNNIYVINHTGIVVYNYRLN